MEFMPLASSEPPTFFFVFMAFGVLLNLAFMAAAAWGGWFVAKKYDQNPTLGAVLGFFLSWMGIVIVWLMGYTEQQRKERLRREQEYRDWWENQGQYQQQPMPHQPPSPQQPVNQIPYGSPPPENHR